MSGYPVICWTASLHNHYGTRAPIAYVLEKQNGHFDIETSFFQVDSKQSHSRVAVKHLPTFINTKQNKPSPMALF